MTICEINRVFYFCNEKAMYNKHWKSCIEKYFIFCIKLICAFKYFNVDFNKAIIWFTSFDRTLILTVEH